MHVPENVLAAYAQRTDPTIHQRIMQIRRELRSIDLYPLRRGADFAARWDELHGELDELFTTLRRTLTGDALPA